MFLMVIATVLLWSCGTGSNPVEPSRESDVIFSDGFSTYSNGLITNEFAYWNPNNPNAKHSIIWELTSGSLFAQNGEGWTGIPDNIGPNALSTNGTNSAVFRLTTKRSDFRDVSVSFSLLNQNLVETSITPQSSVDGVHFFLRYQSEENLYYASINRRDNTAVIKKKIPGGISNGGTYYELSSYVSHTVPYGSWQNVTSTIKNNTDGSVSIELYSEGQLVVQANDKGNVGGPPILNAGKLGIRGDNANLKFKNFVVKSF